MAYLKNKFKDAVPFETINGIRESLYNLGIEVYEQNWEDILSECFSVRLEVNEFPGIGTNGKGTTRSFALASAYGELMERLQNKKLFQKTYGLKYHHPAFPDEKKYDIVQFSEDNPEIMKHLVDDYENDNFVNLLNDYPKLSYFADFYNVFEEKKQNLPSALINMACGTNGMCAGNSSYEALCHGICEIMERYVSKQLLYHQLTLPDIPVEDIEDQKIINIIDLLKNVGLDVIIKDCTLGGVFPVVGVLLLNKSKTRYQLRLGSESVFIIALERCLTEVFQGCDIKTFVQNSMLPIEYHFSNDKKYIKENLTKISKNGTGQFPTSIFYHEPPNGIYRNAFLTELDDNKQSYEHLLRKLKQNDFKLFIRNLSFLNFPAYKIYIPGMSEIFINGVDKIEKRIKTNCSANHLLNIQSCNQEELEFLLGELEGFCKQNPKNFQLKNTSYFRSTNLHLKKTNEFGKMDVRLIVALLGYILRKDKIAAKYFTWYMKDLPENNYSNLNYYRCIMAFLQLKAENIGDKDIRIRLLPLFPENTVFKVLEDFQKRTTKLFSEMPLPSCPHCSKCNISTSCLWKEWDRINAIINEKLSVFDQFNSIQ